MVLRADGTALLAQAAEAVTPKAWRGSRAHRRAVVARADPPARRGAGPRRNRSRQGRHRAAALPEAARRRSCATSPIPRRAERLPREPAPGRDRRADAAVELAKLARLLPAVVVAPLEPRARGRRSPSARASSRVDAADILGLSARRRRARCARWPRRGCRWPMPRTRGSSPSARATAASSISRS